MAGGLNFITENPVTKGYDEAEDRAYATKARNLKLQSDSQDLATKLATAPFEVRSRKAGAEASEAGARSATTNADIAESTKGDKISESGSAAATAASGARTAGVTANIAEQTQGDKLAQSQSATTEAANKARESGVTANVAEQTQGTKVAEANADLAGKNLTNAGTAIENKKRQQDLDYARFDKSMDWLAKGRPDLAQTVAAQGGKQIPPQVLNDAQTQRAMVQLWTEAKTRYPNRPELQVQFIQAAMPKLLQPNGQVQYNPAATATMDNAPPAPDYATAPLRPSTAQPSAIGSLSANDKRLVDVAVKANSKPNPTGLGSAVIDNKGVAQALVRQGRSDLARIYDPTIQAPAAPAAAAPSPNAAAGAGARVQPAAQYRDGQTQGNFSGRYEPKTGFPIYVTPEGRSFVVEP